MVITYGTRNTIKGATSLTELNAVYTHTTNELSQVSFGFCLPCLRKY